jgi:hypothetical protein
MFSSPRFTHTLFSLITSLVLLYQQAAVLQTTPQLKNTDLIPAAAPAVLETLPEIMPAPAANRDVFSLRAASGQTINYWTQNGLTLLDTPPTEKNIPHLVLRRNRELTPAAERSLSIEIGSLTIPAGGAELGIVMSTTDPDTQAKITAVSFTAAITNTQATELIYTHVFTHTFENTLLVNGVTLPTPSGYFDITLRLTRPGSPSETLHEVFLPAAFLLEEQAVFSLPPAPELAPGAAPREMVIYFADTFAFEHRTGARLPRQEVTNFVLHQLAPALIQAYTTQTTGWGFAWDAAWTSYRGEKRLSLALTEAGVWFHGNAPSTANAHLTLLTNAAAYRAYPSLLEAMTSLFHHELFHNLQRNLDQLSGGPGNIAGENRAWTPISEGTAVLAAAYGMPHVELGAQSQPRQYLAQAGTFIAGDAFHGDSLNTSYAELNPYQLSVYWKFLADLCGGMPWIRQALLTLYSGEVIDPHSTDNLVANLPILMDTVFARTTTCPFTTHAESLAAFSRAVYALRLDDGRCTSAGSPGGCGLIDFQNVYPTPAALELHLQDGSAHLEENLPASFGMDFVEIPLDGENLDVTIHVEFVPQGDIAGYIVQAWLLSDSGETLIPLDDAPLTIQAGSQPASFSLETPGNPGRLGLVFTRVDPQEESDPLGNYTLNVAVAR